MAALFQSIATLGTRAIDAFWPAANRRAPLAVDLTPPPATASPAPAAAPPLVLDAHADTLDHVVRAVVHSGFLEEATRLMLVSREHLHDPELLYRTRGVRGAGGRTLLMCAVMRCDVARAAEILGACPTPAARAELLACVDAIGWAALHLACSPKRLDEEGALRMLELLLACGADLLASQRSSKSGRVWHAIHFAACWSARLVQRLVQAGALIDGDAAGASTLCAAAVVGSAQGVRMIPRLVALGARETLGNVAMISFAKWPAVGAQPTDGEVVAALNALVSVGCGLIEPDGAGRTPLDWAAHKGNTPVARALLSLDVPATTSSLVRGAKHPGIVRLLLEAGAPPSGPVALLGQAPQTPLMAAAAVSALESLQLLLAAGASVHRRNQLGDTALMWAVRDRTGEPAAIARVVEALLGAGADVHARNSEGDTALMWAVDSGRDDTAAVTRIVEALLDAGGDVRTQNNDGDTVLHLVASRHAKPWAVAVARLLLDGGADASAVNEDGKTPAQRIPAARHGGELHQLLLEAEEAAALA